MFNGIMLDIFFSLQPARYMLKWISSAYMRVECLSCGLRGEPKCWYSVPGSEAGAFEKVVISHFMCLGNFSIFFCDIYAIFGISYKFLFLLSGGISCAFFDFPYSLYQMNSYLLCKKGNLSLEC